MAGAKIERKYMAHFIDTANLSIDSSSATPSYYRIGEDLEEYNVEMNPDTELVKNILGSNRFDHKGYEPSADADPFYARSGDALFEPLQKLVDERATGDKCKTTTIEVHLWKTVSTNSYEAYRQDAYVVPTSYGGDTSGYQIPFTVNYVGTRTAGSFIPDSTTGGGTFTPTQG